MLAGVEKTGLYARVKASVLLRANFTAGSVVLAGVSGGIDSVALVRLLHALSAEYSFTLVVCHLNHNLRGAEARRDMDFTSALADKLGLRFESDTLAAGEIASAKGSAQAAAREARYAFFSSVAAKVGATRITTAHTLDDVTESMLMRFINGTGLGGLTGIPAVRLPYVRPLIDFKRSEIEDFVAEIGQTHVEDSTNGSDKYLRNDIRHNLVGFIKNRYNPNLLESLSRNARNLSRDEDFLNLSAIELFDKSVVINSPKEVLLSRAALKDTHPALVSRVLLKAAEILGARARFYSNHIDSMLLLISSKNPSGSLDLPGGLRFMRRYEELSLASTLLNVPFAFDIELLTPGRTALPEFCSYLDALAGAGTAGNETGTEVPPFITATCIDITDLPHGYQQWSDVVYFDLDNLLEDGGATERDGAIEGLRVRSFIPGDRIIPFGHGSERKLKEVFIGARVPRSLRPAVALITVGGKVIWAAKIKRSALCPVTKKSVRLLKVEFGK